MSISPPFLAYGPEPRVSVEATVIATGGQGWDKTHTGPTADVDPWFVETPKCLREPAGFRRDSGKRPFLYMKLAAPKKILKIQLAFRKDELYRDRYQYEGKNVRIQVGSSPQYNADDPVCKEIDQLTGAGLGDYDCDTFHEGQYVILSNDQVYLTICEAKVFVEAGNFQNHMIIEM